MFGEIGLDYSKHDTNPLGTSAWKRGRGVIVINDDLHESDEEILMTIWHELGHFYADEYDGVTQKLLSGSESETGELGMMYINQGYAFWKEFIAESIGRFILQKTGMYKRYLLGAITTEDQLNNVSNESGKFQIMELVSNPYLYKYFSRVFSDERFACLKKNGNGDINELSGEYIAAHQITISEIDNIENKNVKLSLVEIYSDLIGIMNKKCFWTITIFDLYKLGLAQLGLNATFLLA